MSNAPDIAGAVITILKHLKRVPLDEVHANIDIAIETLREIQSSTGSANE